MTHPAPADRNAAPAPAPFFQPGNPLLLAALDAVPEGVILTDPRQPDNPIVWANRGFERLTGYAAAEVCGRNCRLLAGAGTDPRARERLRGAIAREEPITLEILNYHKDGTPFWQELSVSPVRDAAGRLAHFIGVQKDVTERRSAEDEVAVLVSRELEARAALRESEVRLRMSLDAGEMGTWDFDPATGVVTADARDLELFGLAPEEFDGTVRAFKERIVPADRAEVARVWEDATLRQKPFAVEFRVDGPDGSVRWLAGRGRPIPGRDGRMQRVSGVTFDVTERRRLEEQLLQAQKMEAVGRLAGGIAHDFNNVLMAVSGHARLLLRHAPESDPRRWSLEEIQKGVERATALTRQLLAFSRRQVLEPRVLDLNQVVAGMQGLLERLIGEDVELVFALDPALGRVRADRGQLEQVVLNLAVNARDAMPQGGVLQLRTENAALTAADARRRPYVQPGRYVRLEVVDTGEGMDAATKERVFEPFFTTKEVGRGTGLGLAMVYGIVKQSGGYVWAESTRGRGSVFGVWLPRVDAPAEHDPPRPAGALRGGSETILLAEDDAAVRRLVRTLLEGAGYTVLEAADGERALHAALAWHGPVHLLLSDVVMPRMRGVELAARLRADRPGLRVLYMSGYAEEAFQRDASGSLGEELMQKPVDPDDLLRRVRALLDRE